MKAAVSRKKLSLDDLNYLARLLSSSLGIGECLELVKSRKNAGMFDDIRKQLDKGNDIGKALDPYLPDKLKAYLIPLARNMSFKEALVLTLRFNELEEGSKGQLFKGVAYPLLMLFITITALYLFDLYGMDAIFRVIGSFADGKDLYQGLRLLLRIIVNVIYYLSLLLSLLAFIYTRRNKVVLFYLFVSRYLPNSLLNAYYSERFMSLFVVCIDAGYSTRQALAILKSMKDLPIISFLAFHLDESLLSGETLKDALKQDYYDQSLTRFVRIASYTNDFSAIIMSYVEMSRLKVRNKLRLYALTLQLVTYAFIGLIVIFIYQVLFMPMQALSLI